MLTESMFLGRNIKEELTSVGLTYIHTCRSYVCYVFGGQKVIVVNVAGVARTLADLTDFGLLREQSSQKWEISCL